MAITVSQRLEFRIPISPTAGFFAQVRLFEFALRRLPSPYREAKVSVYVGDRCDIDAVRNANGWSGGRNVDWFAVPSAICTEFGIHGTADWRWVPSATDADVIILADADTVFLRDIDPLLSTMPNDRPAIRGHMAHFPPPSSGGGLPPSNTAEYWPSLFRSFSVPWPDRLFDYSMDTHRELPQAPAYFNLGMIAVNRAALHTVGQEIFSRQVEYMKNFDSHMRCQIVLSLIAYGRSFDIDALPATYNAANDLEHMKANYASVDDIRVLHYLRTEEIDRSTVLLDEILDAFVEKNLLNPANRLLQSLAKEYRKSRLDLAVPK
jgi:hypothetical protein